MLAVEKAHHINCLMFGTGLDVLQSTLRKEYPTMEFSYDFDDSEEEYVDSNDSPIMKKIEANMTPGDHLVIRRENKGLSQSELSSMTGIAIPVISLMEAGNLPITKENARKIAVALDCDVSDFLA